MDTFWSVAIKASGATAISGLLIYTIYPLILASPAIATLDQKLQALVLFIIATLTFIIAYKIIPRRPTTKTSGNNISITGSNVHGGIVGGDKHEHK